MGEDVLPVAGRPTLTNHPVIGGDALCFPIVPKPPRLWWIHFRSHLHPNPVIRKAVGSGSGELADRRVS